MRTFVVAKTAIFNDQGQLLTLLRSDDDVHRPGGYDLPGGRVDDTEDPLHAALREVEEETGLVLDHQAIELLFATSKITMQEEVQAMVNTVWLGFAAKLPAGATVRLSHEHKDFSWVTLDQAIAEATAQGITQGLFLTHVRDNKLVGVTS